MEFLRKIVKTRKNDDDRDAAHNDRFAEGVYWIGGKISVLVDGPDSGQNWGRPYYLKQDIRIFFKRPEQKMLLTISKQIAATDEDPERAKQISSDKAFVTAFSRRQADGSLIIGYLKDYPINVTSYKGRTYIFYKSWIWGSALGKGSTNFAMGDNFDSSDPYEVQTAKIMYENEFMASKGNSELAYQNVSTNFESLKKSSGINGEKVSTFGIGYPENFIGRDARRQFATYASETIADLLDTPEAIWRRRYLKAER